MALQGFGSWRHLVERFVGALSPERPSAADEAWARSFLGPGEQGLWERMSGPDQRHAVAVARDSVALLGPEPPGRAVVAAALLHDVGKVDSRLGTFSRVGVTLAAVAAGRPRMLRWTTSSPAGSVRSRVGSYLTHDVLGGSLLESAGSDRLTSCWAREHHLPEEHWSIDPHIGAALKTADGD